MREFVGSSGASVAFYLDKAAKRWGITDPIHVAHWLAQMAHESAGFTRTRESLNYSAEALLVKFQRRITQDDALRYGRTPAHPADQNEIANRIYGGEWGKKNLGNTQDGDGSRFLGRGFKQLTGRANYEKCSRALYNDETLLYRPEFLEQLDGASQSAAWFWIDKKLSALADVDDVHAITMKVTGWNGDDDGVGVGFPQRCERLRRAQMIFV